MTPTNAIADLDRKRAERQNIEIPTASPEVLRQLGISRRRWNQMTLVEQIEALQARVVRDADKGRSLAGMPPEPVGALGSDTPVVWFKKTWGGSDEYEYIAILTPKGWIVSGQAKSKPKTWTEVLQFALLRERTNFDPNFHVAAGWARIERPA